MPEIWPGLRTFYDAWYSLGRDMNGVTLFSDRSAWIARHCPDAGEAEAAELLFMALEGAEARVREEQRD